MVAGTPSRLPSDRSPDDLDTHEKTWKLELSEPLLQSLTRRRIHDAEHDPVVALIDIRGSHAIPPCSLAQHFVPVVELGEAPACRLNPSVKDVEIGSLLLDHRCQSAERRVPVGTIHEQHDNAPGPRWWPFTGCWRRIVLQIEPSITTWQLAGEGSRLVILRGRPACGGSRALGCKMNRC
jgi:hypothetical protein